MISGGTSSGKSKFNHVGPSNHQNNPHIDNNYCWWRWLTKLKSWGQIRSTFERLASNQKVEFVTQEFKKFKEKVKNSNNQRSPRDRSNLSLSHGRCKEWFLSYFVGLANYFWWNSLYVYSFLDILILHICTLFIFILWIYVCIDAWLWVCMCITVYTCICKNLSGCWALWKLMSLNLGFQYLGFMEREPFIEHWSFLLIFKWRHNDHLSSYHINCV